MITGLTIKDHIREGWLFNKRVITALVFCIFLLCIILMRLFYLQVLSHEHFDMLSHNNRVNIFPLPPTRGLIHDRNGHILAQNMPTYSLEIVSERIENQNKTIEELQKIIAIDEEDMNRFKKLLKKRRPYESVPIRHQLTEEEVARFSVDRYRFPGVEIEARLSRHYPMGKLASHAIGYVGRIDEKDIQQLDESKYRGTTHTGKIGLEKSYEDILHGIVGLQQAETNAQGRILRVLEKTLPRSGNNLFLHLDMRMQLVAEKEFGDRRGSLIAIDTRNGGILTMVSMPGYDPNLFVNGIDNKTYNALSRSPDKPLFNRALRGQYPPGSTIKPFLGLAGLKYNEANTERKVYCPGWYKLKDGDDRKYRDWKREGHGHMDLSGAIMHSCDVFFYDLAVNLGIDRIHEFMSLFGLGKKTGIDIGGELSGLLPSREWKRRAHNDNWYRGETVITGIGQGFNLTTPLQLVQATTILANRGKILPPRMVYSIQEPDNNEVHLLENKPVDYVEIENRYYWDTIIDAMVKVTRTPGGTAYGSSHTAPYVIAGKTGTAQVFSLKQDEEYEAEKLTEKLRDHALFISFAPAKNPRIAIALIVENAGGGGANAAPIARKVMDVYFKNLETGK
ncbi:MAG: penicillin-binding protein 2 [Gammaproteobacteria bacterium]|nr:penicillin-binding protein 2 [Gammaproteobacteria bacterium]MDH5614253.1 penicillin-binding protein 2 [Gammaproteobacteria bacterium]